MKHFKAEITDQEIRNLVIARLELYPAKRKIFIGSNGSFTRDELIERVKNQDAVGQKIIEVQLNYLRSLKNQRFLG